MLSFANPVALMWWLLAIPITILYLRKQLLKRKTISTIAFWMSSETKSAPAFHWNRPVDLISLLLQLTAVFLLTLFLAEPRITEPADHSKGPKSSALAGDQTILIVDNSASMQVADTNSGTRLTAAIESARNLINSTDREHRFALITTSGSPPIVTPLTLNRHALEDGLNSVVQTDIAGSPFTAMRSVLAGTTEPALNVVVFTDETRPSGGMFSSKPADKLTLMADSNRVHWIQVGESTSNVSISGLRLETPNEETRNREVHLSVTNHGTESRDDEIEIALNQIPLDVIPITVPPGETVFRSLIIPSEASGMIRVHLHRPDPLASDNTVFAVLPEMKRLNVAMITTGNLFLQRALEAMPDVSLRTYSPETISSDILNSFDIAVLDQPDHEVLSLLQKMSIPTLIIAPTADCELWKRTGQLTGPILISDTQHSDLLTRLNFPDLRIQTASQLQFSSAHRTLAETADGSGLITELTAERGNSIVLSFDPASGELPFRAAFPSLIVALIERLADQQADGVLWHSVGDAFVAPAVIQNLSASPDSLFEMKCLAMRIDEDEPGREFVCGLFRQNSQVFVQTPRYIGCYKLSFRRADETVHAMTIAVNGLNAQEGNLLRSPESPGTLPQLTSSGDRISQWMYPGFLCVAAACVLLDWFRPLRRQRPKNPAGIRT
ncbi:MAG: BatA and WFA domain-containing protein [Planctomyces sp.]|nr:BatA and WFA domain-containing protein [Planctomyces sp.]